MPQKFSGDTAGRPDLFQSVGQPLWSMRKLSSLMNIWWKGDIYEGLIQDGLSLIIVSIKKSNRKGRSGKGFIELLPIENPLRLLLGSGNAQVYVDSRRFEY